VRPGQKQQTCRSLTRPVRSVRTAHAGRLSLSISKLTLRLRNSVTMSHPEDNRYSPSAGRITAENCIGNHQPTDFCFWGSQGSSKLGRPHGASVTLVELLIAICSFTISDLLPRIPIHILHFSTFDELLLNHVGSNPVSRLSCRNQQHQRHLFHSAMYR
jgi:hypothetical protein